MDTTNSVEGVSGRAQSQSGASAEGSQSVAGGQAASGPKASRRVLTRSRWKARQFLRRNKIFFETLVPAAILIGTLLVLITQTVIFFLQWKVLQVQTTIQARQISNIPVLGLFLTERFGTLKFELTNTGGAFDVTGFDALVGCNGSCEIGDNELFVTVPFVDHRPTWRDELPPKPGRLGNATVTVGYGWPLIAREYFQVVKKAGGKATLRLSVFMRFEGRDAAGVRHIWYFKEDLDLSNPGAPLGDAKKIAEIDAETWLTAANYHKQLALVGWAVPVGDIMALDLLAWLQPSGWSTDFESGWHGSYDGDETDVSELFKESGPPFYSPLH
ncbi:MAG: hypothetical protein FJ118_03495 [Deltaproteobacteria bacterium]|nr:hypothetical protein [Deltaproteobacteria bacterium]